MRGVLRGSFIWILTTFVINHPSGVRSTSGVPGGNGKSAERIRQDYLVRFLASAELPVESNWCETSTNCHNSSQKCDNATKLCTTKDQPEFPLVLGHSACLSDSDCPFYYECQKGSCHYALFTSCKAKEDCFQRPTHDTDCAELSDHLPGKRCYRKCKRDRDCHDCSSELPSSCRYPEIFQKLISCCAGYCIKRVSCEALLP